MSVTCFLLLPYVFKSCRYSCCVVSHPVLSGGSRSEFYPCPSGLLPAGRSVCLLSVSFHLRLGFPTYLLSLHFSKSWFKLHLVALAQIIPDKDPEAASVSVLASCGSRRLFSHSWKVCPNGGERQPSDNPVTARKTSACFLQGLFHVQYTGSGLKDVPDLLPKHRSPPHPADMADTRTHTNTRTRTHTLMSFFHDYLPQNKILWRG
nr:uncharacterized protein LOC125989345 isoform X1 [Syngnathus scovelli]